MTQEEEAISGSKRRDRKRSKVATLKRKETRSHKRRTKRKERRKKSRKMVQSRVADTVPSYLRAQEAWEQDRLDEHIETEKRNNEANERHTPAARAEKTETKQNIQGDKIIIKHLENQIALWEREITNDKRRQEERMAIQNMIKKWCKRKIQLHKGAKNKRKQRNHIENKDKKGKEWEKPKADSSQTTAIQYALHPGTSGVSRRKLNGSCLSIL